MYLSKVMTVYSFRKRKEEIRNGECRERKKGMSYYFDQSNVLFAQGSDDNSKLREFLDRIVKQIENYDGDNMIEVVKSL